MSTLSKRSVAAPAAKPTTTNRFLNDERGPTKLHVWCNVYRENGKKFARLNEAKVRRTRTGERGRKKEFLRNMSKVDIGMA